ncbi:MAG: SH3 domain-containing protein [Christensenellaceae bacterium]|jgi:uncharacterized protein YgiM (DUF1202 family)|nr:SH3 domain-containing protein [Christensenellaceae bacterium]
MKKLLALTLAVLLCLAMAAPAFAAPKAHDWADYDWHGYGWYNAGVKLHGDAVVTARSLNLRTGAGLSFPIITSFPRGTVVEVIGISDSWAEVVIGYGFKGYMHTDYLSFWDYDFDDGVVLPENTVESKVLKQ